MAAGRYISRGSCVRSGRGSIMLTGSFKVVQCQVTSLITLFLRISLVENSGKARPGNFAIFEERAHPRLPVRPLRGLPLLRRRLDLQLPELGLHAHDGGEHEGGPDDAELEEVAAVDDEVPEEVSLGDVQRVLVDEGAQGEVHLAVADVPAKRNE